MTEKAFPPILHLGAAKGVTGSCHLVCARGLNILVDCGLPQGKDSAPAPGAWPIKPSDVHFVFLTHAHIDHVGRLPNLIQSGFQGKILTTHPTKLLLVPMLEDAMGFSGFSEDEIDDLTARIDERSWSFEYGEEFDLKEGTRFSLRRAGHILGSCSVRLEHPEDGWSVLFSGDIGGPGRPLLPDPEPPTGCGLLVLESTYGDRVHEGKRDRLRTLGKVLTRSLSDGGKVFIPSFALGRTQELIYELERIDSDPELAEEFPALSSKSRIPVFLDSPLGIRLTEIHKQLAPFWDTEAKKLLRSGENPLDFDRLYAAAKYQEHLKLLAYRGPCIIIAGSGMCTGGRILDHLKAGIEDPRNDIVFIGYQAEGTPGRHILDHRTDPGAYVELDGERFPVRAGVHVISGFSAHADRDELIAWVRAAPEPPGRIRLVHGEADARATLARSLRELGYSVDAGE